MKNLKIRGESECFHVPYNLGWGFELAVEPEYEYTALAICCTSGKEALKSFTYGPTLPVSLSYTPYVVGQLVR